VAKLAVGQILEEIANFTLAIATMAAKGANRGEFARLSPAGDRLGIDAKERGDLGWGEEFFALHRALHTSQITLSHRR